MVKNLPTMQKPRFSPWVRKIPWRRAWQPTPVFLPGESHGQRRLAGCALCPRGPQAFSSSLWRWENGAPGSWRLTVELDKAPKVNAILYFGWGWTPGEQIIRPWTGNKEGPQPPWASLGREPHPPSHTPCLPTHGGQGSKGVSEFFHVPHWSLGTLGLRPRD